MTDESCELCGLPVRETRVKNDGEVFCCRGCREVHATLGERALDDSDRRAEDAVPEGCETAFLHVRGMHCTACEIFLERRATEIEGVEAASANYATETLRVDYDERVDEDGIAEAVSGAGYRAFRKDDETARREGRNESVGRLIVGGFFGMMAMVWYVFFLYPTYLGYDPLFPLSSPSGRFLFGNVLVAASVVLFYTGAPVLRGAYVSLRARQPNMDLLVALAAVSAYVYSTVALGLGRTEIYYDVSIAVVLVVSVGGYYERGTKRKALGALGGLTEARVDEARLEGGDVVSVDELDGGERVVVRRGERVPVDGVVVDGSATVDESVVTGESEPTTKREGDHVVGGSVVTDDALVVKTTGGEGALDRVTNLLWDLQSDESGVQRFADRLATVFVPLVIVVASASFVYGLGVGAGFERALLTALTVLVVSCPCALGLATPLAVASGLRDALERGIVVSDEGVFERVREAETFVFDKTGTITTGALEVVEVSGDDETLRRAAAVERLSSHPVAEAVVRAEGAVEGTTDGGVVAEADGFANRANGVEGRFEGERVLVGDESLFEEEGWSTERVRRAVEEANDRGRAVVVGWSGEARGVVTVAEEERERWRDVVQSLSKEGRRVVVLTGDEGARAGRLSGVDGVDRVFSGVPPEAKAETVSRLAEEGTTAMVGDGTNDAPALAAADLGIALGGGTALASDAADVTVLDDDLSKIPSVVGIAESTRRRTRQNVGWALLYNTVAVPLAAFGALNPLLAAGAMATSSLLVTLNSSRPLTKGRRKG